MFVVVVQYVRCDGFACSLWWFSMFVVVVQFVCCGVSACSMCSFSIFVVVVQHVLCGGSACLAWWFSLVRRCNNKYMTWYIFDGSYLCFFRVSVFFCLCSVSYCIDLICGLYFGAFLSMFIFSFR